MLSDGFVIIIKQLSITSDTRVWLRKKKTRFLMHGGGGNQNRKGTTPMLEPFCSQQSLNIK